MKREEASEIINSYFFYTVLPRCNGKVVNSHKLEEAIKMALAALQEQRPMGHWLKPTALSEPICSVCLSAPKLLFGKTSAWCPNCGAKMEGNENEIN